MRIGVGLQEYYCVCATVGLVTKRLFPENASREEQVASDRVSNMTQKVLALQDNYSAAAATLASLPSMVCPHVHVGFSITKFSYRAANDGAPKWVVEWTRRR